MFKFNNCPHVILLSIRPTQSGSRLSQYIMKRSDCDLWLPSFKRSAVDLFNIEINNLFSGAMFAPISALPVCKVIFNPDPFMKTFSHVVLAFHPNASRYTETCFHFRQLVPVLILRFGRYILPWC